MISNGEHIPTGAVVPINIDDPMALLSPASGPVDFDLQIHAVTANGLRYNAAIQASTATSRDHAVTVPFGSALSIRVLAPDFLVNDQSGKATTGGWRKNVTATSGTSMPALSYVVVGRPPTSPGPLP